MWVMHSAAGAECVYWLGGGGVLGVVNKCSKHEELMKMPPIYKWGKEKKNVQILFCQRIKIIIFLIQKQYIVQSKLWLTLRNILFIDKEKLVKMHYQM